VRHSAGHEESRIGDGGTGTSSQWPTCFSADSDAGESWIVNERWLEEAVHCTCLPLPVAATADMLRSIGIWAAGRDFISAALAALAGVPILAGSRFSSAEARENSKSFDGILLHTLRGCSENLLQARGYSENLLQTA
jgi:hypothetical protein